MKKEIEEILDCNFVYKCLICGDEVQTGIVTYNGLFEHNCICVFCDSPLKWVKEEMLANGESLLDYKLYSIKRKFNKSLLSKLKK